MNRHKSSWLAVQQKISLNHKFIRKTNFENIVFILVFFARRKSTYEARNFYTHKIGNYDEQKIAEFFFCVVCSYKYYRQLYYIYIVAYRLYNIQRISKFQNVLKHCHWLIPKYCYHIRIWEFQLKYFISNKIISHKLFFFRKIIILIYF